jgi:hypothetical protein
MGTIGCGVNCATVLVAEYELSYFCEPVATSVGRGRRVVGLPVILFGSCCREPRKGHHQRCDRVAHGSSPIEQYCAAALA